MRFSTFKALLSCSVRLSEVHRKTGSELVSNSIVRRNLGTKQNVPSQIPPHNAIVDEFCTSPLLNFGKASYVIFSKHFDVLSVTAKTSGLGEMECIISCNKVRFLGDFSHCSEKLGMP